PAIDHRVGKILDMSGCFPRAGMHEDRSVDPFDIPPPGHILPPCLLDISQELHPERAVVPGSIQSAVNLRRLEDKTSPFTEGNELLHELRLSVDRFCHTLFLVMLVMNEKCPKIPAIPQRREH